MLLPTWEHLFTCQSVCQGGEGRASTSGCILGFRAQGIEPLSLSSPLSLCIQERGSEGTGGGRVMLQKLAFEGFVRGRCPCTGYEQGLSIAWTCGGHRGVWGWDHRVVLESWVFPLFQRLLRSFRRKALLWSLLAPASAPHSFCFSVTTYIAAQNAFPLDIRACGENRIWLKTKLQSQVPRLGCLTVL